MRPVLDAVGNLVFKALEGGPVEIEVKRESKTRDQEAKYHAMIADIAKTVEIDGRHFDAEVWKAWLVDDFENEKKAMGETLHHPGRTVLSLDGTRVVTIRPTTTKFQRQEAGEFIEYLYAKGTELGATFTDYVTRLYEEEMKRRGLL